MNPYDSSSEQFDPLDDLLIELMEELTQRAQRGDGVDIDAYAAEHPEHADQLRKIWTTLTALEDINRSSVVITEINKTYEASLGEQPVFSNVGDFRIVSELGRGGMGVVYLAEQVSVGRQVALKILPFAALLNEHQLERFATEASAAARLQHSSIVQVYTVGCERGIHFYAMQLIDGPSLAEMISELRQDCQTPACTVTDDEPVNTDTVVARKSNALTQDVDSDGHYRAVARIGCQAAEALQYAHENGVLHRDIKPSNLLLDHTGHVWIVDFGLARVEDESELTRTGDLLGTLRYMSPEQATGQRGQIDARSDVYSLGATLYELATLKPVFDHADRREVIRQVAAGKPVPPHKINSQVPKPLSRIISKAMAQRPDRRYQSAQEMAEDLRRFAAGETVHARPTSFMGRTGLLQRSHLIVTTPLLLVICLSGFLIAHRFSANAPQSISSTRRPSTPDTEDPKMFRNAPKNRSSCAQVIRMNERNRLMRHEQLEDRRMLAGTISGTVFEDLNGDGAQNPDEPGMPGETVVLERTDTDTPLLTIPNPTPESRELFGVASAAMGDDILIGSYDNGGGLNAGAVYLMDGDTGELLQTYTSPNPTAYERFGASVATVGDDILVGTRRNVLTGGYSALPGVAYLLDGSTGALLQTFYDPMPEPDPQPGDGTNNYFGGAQNVAAYGDYVLIGSPNGDVAAEEAGAVHMFNSNDGTLVRTFVSPSPNSGDNFGNGIEVVGDSLLVSSRWDDTAGTDAGAAYMYDLQSGELLHSFYSPLQLEYQGFGANHFAVIDDIVAIPARGQSDYQFDAVYLFDLTTGGLIQTIDSPQPEQPFGKVGAVNNHLYISAFSDDVITNPTPVMQLYDPITGKVLQTFQHPNPSETHIFGRSFTSVGSKVVITDHTYFADADQAGAVFVFETVDSVTSDSLGRYSFTEVESGEYAVIQISKPGYALTVPSGDGTHHVALMSSEDITGIDFGNQWSPEPLFFDSFENGQWNGRWTEDSQNDWFTSTQRKTEGSYSAEVDGYASDATLTIANPIDLTTYGSAEMTFDWYIESGFDAGEYLALDLFDGSDWNEVTRLSGNVDRENTWHNETITVDAAYLVDDFQLRFRAKVSSFVEDANVDNVRLVATSLAPQPNIDPTAVNDVTSTAEDNAVEEDQSNDSERSHTTEQVAYFVIDPPMADLFASNAEPTAIRSDVNGDGRTSPLDALLLIEWMNTGSAQGEFNLYDVNLDGRVSPMDALLVIDSLNHPSQYVQIGHPQATATAWAHDVDWLFSGFTDGEEETAEEEALLPWG